MILVQNEKNSNADYGLQQVGKNKYILNGRNDLY